MNTSLKHAQRTGEHEHDIRVIIVGLIVGILTASTAKAAQNCNVMGTWFKHGDYVCSCPLIQKKPTTIKVEKVVNWTLPYKVSSLKWQCLDGDLIDTETTCMAVLLTTEAKAKKKLKSTLFRRIKRKCPCCAARVVPW